MCWISVCFYWVLWVCVSYILKHAYYIFWIVIKTNARYLFTHVAMKPGLKYGMQFLTKFYLLIVLKQVFQILTYRSVIMSSYIDFLLKSNRNSNCLNFSTLLKEYESLKKLNKFLAKSVSSFNLMFRWRDSFFL